MDFFRECFYSSLTLTELRSDCRPLLLLVAVMPASRAIVGIGDCFAAYPYPILLTLFSTWISLHGLPRFGGWHSCLVVTCGLSRFTRVLPCNKKITGEQTVKMLVE